MNILPANEVDEAFILHMLRTKCQRTASQNPQEAEMELELVRQRIRKARLRLKSGKNESAEASSPRQVGIDATPRS